MGQYCNTIIHVYTNTINTIRQSHHTLLQQYNNTIIISFLLATATAADPMVDGSMLRGSEPWMGQNIRNAKCL